MSLAEAPGALLLTPGAGSDRHHPSLVAIEAAVAPMVVARVDFPYRRAGRRAPDRPSVMVACVVEEAAALAARTGVPPERIVLGGRSMGGRMCSMAAAEGLPAAGLVLIAYPLHPPGRPERLRTEHFPVLEVACLFVSGTRDPFAAPGELEAASARIAGPVTHVWIEGAGHGIKGADAAVAASVAAWLTGAPPGPETRPTT
ncbi:MAG: dienelactone hydrolase [Actinomycetota bacterium]|nr:dienelactone hydrolase [Actinomycetota bacterium]